MNKVLLEKKSSDGALEAKLELIDGKLVASESADLDAYLKLLEAKISGSIDDLVIEYVRGLLKG